MTGLDDIDVAQRTVAQIARDSCNPALRVDLDVLDFDEGPVLHVAVPGFLPERPFRGDSRFFVRDGAMSREATSEELKHLLHGSTAHFDEQPAPRANRADLDPVLIAELVARLPSRARVQDETLLRALRAITDDGTPTLAGVLMLSAEPQRFVIDAYVTAVRFRGVAMSRDLVDRKELRGTVVHQLEQAVAFLELHTPASSSSSSGLKRVDRRIPPDVWREVVANALAHRDYAVPSQVRIFVFDDRVEVINPGGLLNHMTVDSIRLGGVSQRRNPYLANMLHRLGYREDMGVGVVHMIRELTEAGYPEPEFEVRSGEMRVTLRLEAPS
ncbi:MAG: hypothetical protein KF901_16215 [Myxococcales bacterium]|nr:hypothetical protein [Myxococcales bacterium]